MWFKCVSLFNALEVLSRVERWCKNILDKLSANLKHTRSKSRSKSKSPAENDIITHPEECQQSISTYLLQYTAEGGALHHRHIESSLEIDWKLVHLLQNWLNMQATPNQPTGRWQHFLPITVLGCLPSQSTQSNLEVKLVWYGSVLPDPLDNGGQSTSHM